jgi:hypothetical protein
LPIPPGEQGVPHLDRIQAEELTESIEREDGFLASDLDPLHCLDVNLALLAAEEYFLAKGLDAVAEHGPQKRKLTGPVWLLLGEELLWEDEIWFQVRKGCGIHGLR